MRRTAALAAAGLLLLAGCGKGTVTVEATPAAIAAAGEATIAAGTARMVVDITAEIDGEPFELTSEGVVDFVNGRTELRMDMAAMAGLAGGADVPDGAEQLFEGEMRTVTDGATVYVCASMLELFAPSGCMRVDVPGAAASDMANQLADPLAALRSLAGAESVEDLGTEEIDGVATSHFRGEYTLRTALDALDATAAEELRALAERGDLDLDGPQSYDVWIDGDGLARQVANTMEFAVAGQSMTMSAVTRFFDFGAPVDIQVPTDATSFEELQGLLGG